MPSLLILLVIFSAGAVGVLTGLLCHSWIVTQAARDGALTIDGVLLVRETGAAATHEASPHRTGRPSDDSRSE